MKKKILTALLSLVATFNTFTFVGYATNDISVTLNGEKLIFDVQPQLIDNRTMVPLRKIFEAMGAEVEWNNDTQTVTATKNSERVIATVNNKNAYVSGDTKVLDVPPLIVDGRTMVPTRFVAESFGANVSWDESTRTVVIITKWDGTGEIPYYKNYSDVPDFGAIVGVPSVEYNPSTSGVIYKYNIKDILKSDLSHYLSVMEDSGFTVKIGASIPYVCSKNGLYVDIVIDDYVNICITLPKNQISSVNVQEFNNSSVEWKECSQFGIKYKIPSDWKEPVIKNNIIYYYPIDGMLMLQCKNNISDKLDEITFRYMLDGMSKGIENYQLLSKNKIILPNDNLEAYSAEYTGVISNSSISAKTVFIQLDNSLVSLTYCNFHTSSNDMQQFDKIINSITIDKYDKNILKNQIDILNNN